MDKDESGNEYSTKEIVITSLEKDSVDSPDYNIKKRKRTEDQDLEGKPNVKKKRNRTQFTTDQIEHLEEKFKISQYPDTLARKEISRTLKVKDSAIVFWFQNRRAKQRKYENQPHLYGVHRTGRRKVAGTPKQVVEPPASWYYPIISNNDTKENSLSWMPYCLPTPESQSNDLPIFSLDALSYPGVYSHFQLPGVGELDAMSPQDSPSSSAEPSTSYQNSLLPLKKLV